MNKALEALSAVFVPCVEHVEDPGDAVVEFRHVGERRLALMVYSTVEELESCCGERKPWLRIPVDIVDRLRQAVHFDLILLDAVIPEEQRSTEVESVETRTVPQKPRHTTA